MRRPAWLRRTRWAVAARLRPVGGSTPSRRRPMDALGTPFESLRRLVARSGEERRARAAVAALAGATARSLRAGSTLPYALRQAASVLPSHSLLLADLTALRERLDGGAPLEPELRSWAERRGWPEVDLLVAACCLGSQTGSGLARALDGVAASLLDQAEVARETRALATQARWSAGVLVLAPPLGALLFGGLDPGVAHFLFATGTGQACAAAALALDLLGALWMRRLVRDSLEGCIA